jgi:hypothetical protein|tara:strand:+ start:1288 stop:1539 length:252 start_codon:yes stop_codon:yes gene_type:complete
MGKKRKTNRQIQKLCPYLEKDCSIGASDSLRGKQNTLLPHLSQTAEYQKLRREERRDDLQICGTCRPVLLCIDKARKTLLTGK